MGVRSYIKNTAKANTNVKGWMSWDAIRSGGQVIGGLIRGMKNSDAQTQPIGKFTFEEMMQRFNWTEKDVQRYATSHFRVALFCVLLGLFGLGWTIYLFAKFMLLSGCMSLSLAFLMFAYAFREHFYYFQFKKRRLNCTVQEWFSGLFSR